MCCGKGTDGRLARRPNQRNINAQHAFRRRPPSPWLHWEPPTRTAYNRSRRGRRLGDVSGVAYTVEPDEYALSTTLAQGEAGTPIRFVSVLAPGQRIVLSTPHQAGAVEISRNGDNLLVRKAKALTNWDGRSRPCSSKGADSHSRWTGKLIVVALNGTAKSSDDDLNQTNAGATDVHDLPPSDDRF